MVGEGQRQEGHPPVEEILNGAGAELVTDRLQRLGIVTAPKPVGERGEADARPAGLAFGPLMTIDPDFRRVGKICADLDEGGAEVDIPEAEVEARHTPVRFREREPRGNSKLIWPRPSFS